MVSGPCHGRPQPCFTAGKKGWVKKELGLIGVLEAEAWRLAGKVLRLVNNLPSGDISLLEIKRERRHLLERRGK